MDLKRKLRSRNNGFGPVSVKRKNLASVAVMGFASSSILIVFAVRYFVRGIESTKLLSLDDIVLACGVLSALITGEFVRRLCLFVEERKHAQSRYSGSYVSALDACICLSSHQVTLLCYGCASALFLIFTLENIKPLSMPTYFMVVVCYVIVKHRLPAKSLAPAEVSDLNEQDSKNIASGLAWSYYFGYLKLVLPGFRNKIADAVSPNFTLNGKDLRDFLPPENRKLFIIIPSNCHCYNELSDVDPRINFAGNLPEERVTRGGVQSRVYKQSLYCISAPGREPLYAALEYATPLLTMYDMMHDPHAGISLQDVEEQVVLFVRTLKEILERDKEIKDNVQLLLVGDVHNDLADTIVNAMSEQRYQFE